MAPRSIFHLALPAICLVCAALPASAQSPGPDTDLLTATCADLMEGLKLADPGPGASADQKRIALEAQDDIATGLAWVHGYQAGRGSGATPPAMTRRWMADTLPRLAQACTRQSPDGKMRLADVVARL